MAKWSIMRCMGEQRQSMWSNVVLSGGVCEARGMAERVRKDLKLLAPNTATVNVVDVEDKKYLECVGAEVFATQA